MAYQPLDQSALWRLNPSPSLAEKLCNSTKLETLYVGDGRIGDRVKPIHRDIERRSAVSALGLCHNFFALDKPDVRSRSLTSAAYHLIRIPHGLPPPFGNGEVKRY